MLSKLLLALRSALVGTLSLLATASLAQTTIHVGPGQTYTTIQSGINAAVNGDTVLVAPGTYNENIDFKGKAITVTSSDGVAATTILGGGTTSTVVFRSNESRKSVIQGFAIQGGVSDGNPAGGGVFVQNASPEILNNTFSQNSCTDITSYNSAPLIMGNTLNAPYFQAILECPFEANWLVLSGVASSYPNLFSEVIGNTISAPNNTTGNGVVTGPGIKLQYVNGAIIKGNIIAHIISDEMGAGIESYGCTATVIAQNLIYQNSISFMGNAGGRGGGGGGINISVAGHTQQGHPTCLIFNNTIALNVDSFSVGGDYPSASQLYLEGNLSQFVVANNLLVGNDANPSFVGGSDSDSYSPVPPVVENNDVFNSVGPACDECYAEPFGTNGNISVDPVFASEVEADFHLQSESPAVDVGDNDVLDLLNNFGVLFTTDLDGKARVQDATGKGCIIDMGVYEYTGTTSDCTASESVSETLKSSLNPATASQSITFTAQLTASSGIPTGAIQFLDGVAPLSTQPVSSTGSAAFTTSTLAVGSHTITANYLPTGSFGASTASLTQIINGVTTGTALTCQPNIIGINGTSLFTATVRSANGTPTGSIAFTDNGASLATQPLLNGSASYSYTGSKAGTHAITGAYAATGLYGASSSNCTVVVQALPTVSTLYAAPAHRPYGVPVIITANVAPASPPGPSTPTGTVTFLNGATTIATTELANNGQATITTSPLPGSALPGGTDNLTCMYSGSTIYAPSNCNTVPIVVSPAASTLTLSSSDNPSPYPNAITVTARLTFNGEAAGAGNAIVLSIRSQRVALTTDATGSASHSIGSLTPGSYPVNASFAGTNDLLASSASLTEIITAATTSITLTGSPNPANVNQSVTLTATASSQTTPVGSGKVTFYDGVTSLGSSQLSATGTAALTTSFSVAGVHNLTAVYGGDADFSSSTSAVLKEAIVAGDFSILAKPGAVSVYTGLAASFKVGVTSLQGFNQPLALTCSGLPANATCSFSPASLPQGQGAANLIVQTAAPHKASAAARSGSAAILAALTLVLLPGGRQRRRYLARVVSGLAGLSAVLLAIAFGIGLAGCASVHPITGGTPPGTYKLAVTATTTGDGTALTHSDVVTLTVKSLF